MNMCNFNVIEKLNDLQFTSGPANRFRKT